MDRFTELKTAVGTAALVDAHAHNIVAVDSAVPFLNLFSEATGDALSYAPHTINFKRSLKEIAELYGSDLSFDAVQEYRSSSGVESITGKCLKTAGISAIFIDDGLELDKMHGIEWHKAFVPFVGRILRIERVAEKILDEGSKAGTTWTLDSFTAVFVENLKSYPFDFSLIAAYRSGLEINTNVSETDAEEGLYDVLRAGSPARITNKNLIDHIFIHALEVAQNFDLPMQIHTGFGDKDLDLRLSNPLHLRNVLEDSRFSMCRIGSFTRIIPIFQRSIILGLCVPSGKIWKFIWTSGLAVPKLSFHGMLSSVKELLELAPIKKVMFSTDGCAFPESFYLGWFYQYHALCHFNVVFFLRTQE
ncbi:hypothetical protein BUALT_Bualt11G0106100 [Buddleja alternifolia]|uniref:Amidohydrolase-related domain-containing protein n=1 Tax=Buddleja alternifolia TaxID=168488 RepID=A0AAV6X4X2_9LAMI|nr:hypothetical protein BUALT_Bualt11G0106100 [Buddleja alternifolia]